MEKLQRSNPNANPTNLDGPSGEPPFFEPTNGAAASVVDRENGDIVVIDAEGNMTPIGSKRELKSIFTQAL